MPVDTRTRQRAQNPFLGIVSVTPLTTADLAELKQPAPVTDIVRLRAIHHEIAYHVAMGKTNAEIAEITGYGPARITTIVNAPSVKDLIAGYNAQRERAREAAIDDFERAAAANMKRGERLVGDFLDAVIESDKAPDLPTVRAINKLVVDRMDRFGYGRQSTNTNVNLNFAAKLEAAISRTAKVIDHDDLT